MDNIATLILKHKRVVISLFLVLAVASIFFGRKVKINYDLVDYLPEGTNSIVALEKMTESYSATIPNVKVLIPDVTINDAVDYKHKIEKVKGVEDVLWADDYMNLSSLTLNTSQINSWYKNNDALFLISINTEHSLDVINKIKKVVKDDAAFAGDAVNVALAQVNMKHEINAILLFVVPIILIILLLTTSSWFEPILFLITIGISIIINMGTNIMLGEISSVTNTTAAILQLAVSMDYAIFLLHYFATLRHNGKNVEEAMAESIKNSAIVIVASALTTILGFLSLVLMKFRIGPDLGIVLGKGVIFSLVSVLFLLPVFAVYSYKIIDKTHHKSLIPSFNKVGNYIVRLRVPITIIILLIIIPSFLASRHNNYLYGSTGINSENSKVYKDTELINKKFGVNNQMILLIPNYNYKKELALDNELEKVDKVTSVTSFATIFGTETPLHYLPHDIVSQFISDKYSKIIISADVPEEGKNTFNLVKKVRSISNKYYKNDYYLAGVSPTNYDMKNVVIKDNFIVNIVAILSIFAILILTFKGLLIPIILLLTIEISIWINLSIAYIMGYSLNYIGYLIISTVQLGATVDYAILFAKRYLEKRKMLAKKESAIKTISDTAPSILSSALILGISGFSLGFISSNGIISELGSLVGRGALISAFMVLLFIPSIFIIFDKIIFKKISKQDFIIDEKNGNDEDV
jgi:predicted RND superfamily exporter protein